MEIKLYTEAEIRKLLLNENIAKLSRDIGFSRQTLYNFMKKENFTMKLYKALIRHFNKESI